MPDFNVYINKEGAYKKVPVGRENEFLSKYPGSRQATKEEISIYDRNRYAGGVLGASAAVTSTQGESNTQEQTSNNAQETPSKQPNNGIIGGFTTFKDRTSGFIPEMKTPNVKLQQSKIDISYPGKKTEVIAPFGNGKPLTESIGNTMKSIPVSPKAQFDISQSTYKQEKDWIKEVEDDPSISPEVKKALIKDYNKNIRISDNSIDVKDLPLYAKQWLKDNEVDVPTSMYVQGSSMFGGGKYVEGTKKANTPEQISFIKDFIANTPQGQDLVKRQNEYVNYLENSISEVESRIPDLKKKYWQDLNDLSSSHPYTTGNTQGKSETDAAREDYINKSKELAKRMSALSLAEKNAEDQKKLLSAIKDGDLNVLSQFGKQIGRDFGEMAGDIGTLGIRPMMQSLYELKDVKELQRRIDNKEPISEEDRLAMFAMANNQAYQELMGDKRTISQEVASGITQSAPFMITFATTGGVGKAVTGGVKELLKQGIKRNALNAIRSGAEASIKKIGARLAGFGLNVADATARASVMAAISPQTYRDMFDNMRGNVTYGYDKDGKPYYLGNVEQMDITKALLNAWGSNTIENVSEFSGFGMEKGQATLSRLLKQRVPEVSKVLSLGSTRNEFFQGVNKAMKQAGFNGTVNEYLEEQVATVLHSFFEDGQAQWSDLVDPRQQFITFLTVASIGSGSAILNTGGNQLMKYGAKKAYNNAFQDFGTEFYNSQNNDIAGVFADKMRNGTIEEKQSTLSNIVDSDLFNDKQKLAALNLYRSGLTFESYEGSKQAQIDEAVKEIPAIIEENVNPKMGSVIHATIAGMDTPVQIADGNILQNEDGSIDREKSDQAIYYTDSDGKRKVTSIKNIENITENIPVQDAIDQVTEQVAAPIIAQQENEEVRPYQAGETVRFSPDGNTSFIGQISAQDQTTGNYLLSVETPNGIQQMQVEPRQIINEDNLQGVENGSPVIYTNQNGQQIKDVVATTPDLYLQGLIGFENGDVVPISNVIGLAQNSETGITVSEQDTNNVQPISQQNEDTALPEQSNVKVNESRVFEIGDGLSATENTDGTYSIDKQFPKSDLKKADNLINKLNEDYSDNGLVFELVQLPKQDASNPFEKPLWGVVARLQQEVPTTQTEISSQNRENEHLWNVAENSDNPIEISSAYNEAMQSAGEEILQEWQKQLIGRKINRSSFERFGDRNYINGTIARSWFNRKGEETPLGTIDVVAQELGVTEQDIIDFIINHPSNRIKKGNELTQALNDKFRQIAQEVTGREVGGIESNSGKLFLSTLEYAANNTPTNVEVEFMQSDVITNIPSSVEFFLSDYMNLDEISDFNQFRDAVEEADKQGYFMFPLEPKDKEVILNYINNAERQANAVQGIGEDVSSQQIPENVESLTINEQIVRAESETNTNPTEAQKEAGNYKKGKVTIQGLDISIEQPRGSVRSGTDQNGKEWSIEIQNTYGYIGKTKSRDGDHIDVFLGNNPESKTVFVVDQINQDQSFDEHKVMLGFDSIEQAREAYLSNYEEGWQGLGNITQTDIDTFKKWAKTDGRRIKPFADYKSIQGSKNEGSDFDISNYIGKELYHGSPDGEITKIDPYAHTQNWKEGIGFYTTESKDKAQEYANGKTANSKRKSDKGAITKITFPGDVKVLNMDAKVDIPLWKDISKNLGIETPLLSGSNLDAYNELISSYNDELGTTEGQYAIEEALLNYGYDASTHMEGLNSTPHRVFIWKNEFKLPYIGEVRLQLTNNVFKPINEQTFNSLVDRLRKTGLAREVVTDKTAFDAKLDEVINDNATARQVLSEMDTIKQEATTNGTFMLAPNGKPTKLNENQWLQVRTKPFLNWFGDWINNPRSASKVVDDNGEPMVVYHGTNAEFTEFNSRRINKYSFENEYFFTSDIEYAEEMAKERNGGTFLYEVFLNIKNPNLTSLDQGAFFDPVYEKPIIRKSRENNNDGVFIENKDNTYDDGTIFIAFASNQIKSAISNTGEFDSSNPDIRMQVLEDSTNVSELKEKQLATVLKYNPAPNDINTWIRSTDDILTAEEAFENTLNDNSDFFEDSMYPDFTAEDMRNALDVGEITVYSSYPIKKGVFITPSRMNAEGYAGGEKIYSKTVKLTDVAWIDESEGQYAPVRFMRTNVGDVYGFVTPDGTVYLDSTRMNANTPIHEFGHLWNSFIKENNTDLYNRGAELIKESEYWQRVNDNPSYRNLSDDAKVDEALAMAIGDKGEAITNRSLKQQFVDWLSEVWQSIKRAFGINTNVSLADMTLSDFTDYASKQLLSGENIADEKYGQSSDTRYYIGETKRISYDGRYIKFTRPNPTIIYSTVKKYLDKKGIKYNIDVARTGSKYIKANYETFDADIRFSNHTKGTYGEFEGNGVSYTIDGSKINDISIDISENDMNSKDIISLLDAIEVYNQSDIANEIANKYTYTTKNQKISNEDIGKLANIIDVIPNFISDLEREINNEYRNNQIKLKRGIENRIFILQENLRNSIIGDLLSDGILVKTNTFPKYISTDGYVLENAISNMVVRNKTKPERAKAINEFSSLYEQYKNKYTNLLDQISKVESELKEFSTIPRGYTVTRFQSVNDLADATGSTMSENMRNELDKKIKNLWFRIREAWEDRYLAVKEFLDLLRENGTEVADHNDFYKKVTHVNGAIDAQLEIYNNNYQKPLNKAISELEKVGFDYRDIENYAILKHGLERNAWMKQDAINQYMANNPEATPEQIAKFEQNLPNDFSGISAVEEEVNKKAKLFINEFESKAGKDLIDNLWKRVKDATSYSLNKQLEGGLIDKKTVEDLISRYNYYVPLRGHDTEVAEDRWDYSPDMGTYFVAPLMKAKGRKTRSESPFAYIASMAQSSINSANRNILNQTILRLSRKDKTGMLSVNKAWYEKTGEQNGKPVYEVRSPEYNEDPEIYRKNIEEFEVRMAKLAEVGLAVQSGNKLDIGGLFIKRNQAEQHEVHVYQNGTEYVVYINANPAVARAINGSNAKDLHKDLRFFAKVSRQMAANFTTRNPIFVASNFSRDYIFSSSILPVKESAKYFVQFQRNMIPSADALQRYVRGKADLNKQQDRYLNEYILNGAKTGFSHIVELQKVQKQIERDIKKGEGRNVFRYLLDGLEGMNEFAENLSRLSVYITSREEGRSVTQSVSDAKEVTVNFNRSGTGGFGAAWFRSLYLFINAGIQALSNFAKVAQKNKAKTAMLISSYAMSGFLMPILTSLIGGDDGLDDYLKLSDWERQNNFCIYTGNGFIKIPLPHELRVFHKMGDEIYQSTFGKKDVTQSLLETVLGFSDLVPSNPMGAIQGSWADIMPDATKPFFQLAANRNFTGSRITNEWADPNKPGYLRVRTNKKGEPFAPAFLVKLAETLDNTTGGDGVEKGIISLNPDVINHLMRGYFGGLYNMGMQSLDLSSKTYDWSKSGEFNLKVRETPLKTFYTSESDLQTSSSGLNSKYFKIVDDTQEAIRKIKGYKEQVKNGKLSVVEFSKKIENMDVPKTNDLYGRIKQIKKYESALKDLDGKDQKDLEKIISDRKKEVIEVNNKLSE